MKLAGVGDNVVDRYRDLGTMFPGGQALNVAVYAHRFDMHAAYLGVLGDDVAGRHVLGAMTAEGIETDRVRVVPGPNAAAEVAIVDGNREFIESDAGVSKFRLTAEDLAYLGDFELIHSSESSFLEDQLGLLAGVAPLSFDFSVRREPTYIEPILPHVSIAEFSLSDLTDGEAKAWLERIHGLGPRLVLATRGASDALLFDGQKLWRQPAVPTEPIDTLGAGDAFIARFLVGTLRDEPVDQVLASAAQAAVATCAAYGAFGYGTAAFPPVSSGLDATNVSQSPAANAELGGAMNHLAGIRRHRRGPWGLVAALTIVVAACGGSGTTAPPASSEPGASTAPAQSSATGAELEGDITFLHKYSDPRYAPYFDAVVADYMAAHPKVKIEVQAESDQGVKDKLRVLAASNTLPDIYFSWAGDFTKKFVRGDLAKDLTGDVTGEWKDRFTPAALDAYTYDGKLYGVPITLDAKYMVYNKQLFADNGIAVPTTLEELYTACDAFKAKGITDPITFGNVNGWPAIHFMTQLNPYMVPAATLAKDYDPATGEFTDPGYQKALEAFADINTHCLSAGSNGITHEAAQAQFLAGKSPMHYIEAVEFFALTEKGGAPAELANNWDFFKLPAPASAPGDTGYLTGAPDGFLVNPKSEHPEIALDFLNYLTSLDNAKKMVADLGWLSPVKGSATADNTFPQNVQVIDDIAAADGMAIWLDTVTHIDVANAYLNGVQAMLDGTKTAADVVADVQAAAVTAKASAQ